VTGRSDKSQAEDLLEGADASLLEIIDHVLNKGVMVHGELFLGVAGVDLIYLRVSAMLCAADKVLPAGKGEK
jgi:Gas vesicle protein